MAGAKLKASGTMNESLLAAPELSNLLALSWWTIAPLLTCRCAYSCFSSATCGCPGRCAWLGLPAVIHTSCYQPQCHRNSSISLWRRNSLRALMVQILFPASNLCLVTVLKSELTILSWNRGKTKSLCLGERLLRTCLHCLQ